MVSDVGDARPALEALTALVVRLWTGDFPEDTSVDEIGIWIDRLPEEEALALNCVLGESFGARPLTWEADHPIAIVIGSLAPDIGGEGK